MPTEKLEPELRRMFTQAAGDYPDADLAQQRLLSHGYRPRGVHWGRAAGLATVAAASATVAGLALAGTFSPAPASPAQLAAFTLTSNANGTKTLRLHPGETFHPAALQKALAGDGIPALVKVNVYCTSHPAAPSLSSTGAITIQQQGGAPVPPSTPGYVHSLPRNPVTVIHPAKIPSGTELSFEYLDGDHLLTASLIYTNSHTCRPGPPPSTG